MTIQSHSTTGHSEPLWADVALLMALVVIAIALVWQYI